MEIIEELKDLGLDENEIKVYLACLPEIGANVLEISKKTNIIRTTVYGLVQSLMKKGFLSSINKDKIMFFRALTPKELINIVDQRKLKILSIIPKLEMIRTSTPIAQKIDFFEGKEGVKTIINDLLSIPNQTVKLIGAGTKWVEFSKGFATNYYLRKKESNVKTKSLLTDNKEERIFAKGRIANNAEYKFIKEDFSDNCTFIYSDKVSFINLDSDNVKGFIIEDKKFNKVLNTLFDNIWKNTSK